MSKMVTSAPVMISFCKLCFEPGCACEESPQECIPSAIERLEQRTLTREKENLPVMSLVDACTERRDKILSTLQRANAEKVAKAKRIARREQDRRLKDSLRLAELIQNKLKRAETSRSRIQMTIQSKAAFRRSRPRRRSRSDSMKERLRKAQTRRVSAARMRRQEGFNKRRARLVAHLERVQRQHKKMKTIRLLQEWWKRALVCSRRVQRVKEAGGIEMLETILNPISAQSEFDLIAAHLTTPDVIHAMKKLLQSTCFAPSAKAVSMATVRSTLAAFIINRQAELVIGQVKSESVHSSLCRSADLMEKAQVELLNSLKSGKKVNSKILLFRAVRKDFAKGFLQWKRTDAVRLSEQILETYLKVKATLRDYQDRARKSSRKSLAKDPGLEQLIQGSKAQLEELEAKCKRILPQKDYEAWLSQAAVRLSEDEDEPEPEPEPKTQARPRVRTASLPKSGAPELPPNDVIVHQLLLNPTYKVCDDVDPVYDETQEHYETNPLFSAITEQLIAGDTSAFLDVMDEVGARLKQTIPNRKDIHKKIDEELVLGIAAALEAGEFGNLEFCGRVSYIESIITSLQAPARTAKTHAGYKRVQTILETTDWRQVAPFALDFTINQISQLERDLANAHVALLAGAIKDDKGVQYVRSSFRKRAHKGEFSLGKSGVPAKTEAWIATNMQASRPVNEVITSGFAEIVCSPIMAEDLFASSLPETIGLYNAAALWKMNEEVRLLSLQVVVEIMFSQVVPKVTSSLLDEFRQEVRKVVELKDPLALQAIVLRFALEAHPAMKEKEQTLLQSLIKNAPEGTVYNTILRRLKALVASYLKSLYMQSNQAEEYLPDMKAGRSMPGQAEEQSDASMTEFNRRAVATLSKVGLKRAGLLQWKDQTLQILGGVGEVYLLNVRIFDPVYAEAYTFLSKNASTTTAA